ATGGAATQRLQILHSLYAPGTCRVLLQAGVRPGMRGADLGCGVGMGTMLLRELGRPSGHGVGGGGRGGPPAQARELWSGGSPNISFVAASATDTGLPRAAFDLVYCRFLLIHLTEPERALKEMHDLLKPGGILVCEDGDLMSAGSQPPSSLDVFADL